MPGAEVRVSVCLASYDGAAWIVEQVRSILDQLGPDDELVVVDDASTDDTVALVQRIGDPRISLWGNETNVGYVRTFERALGRARGAYLLLSDQDDVWVPGRLEALVAALDRDGVVASSVAVLGEPDDPPRWRLRAADSHRYAANVAAVLVGVRWYFGCGMGLRRDVLDLVLPFPAWLTESHDLWIGLVGNVHHEMGHLEAASVRRRLHEANQTPQRWRSLPAILQARVMLARCLVEARRRRRVHVGSGTGRRAQPNR
ncbi:MAG: glycosyltransferase [Lapillicoccus sp.]